MHLCNTEDKFYQQDTDPGGGGDRLYILLVANFDVLLVSIKKITDDCLQMDTE